jgi:hypothetical protein
MKCYIPLHCKRRRSNESVDGPGLWNDEEANVARSSYERVPAD